MLKLSTTLVFKAGLTALLTVLSPITALPQRLVSNVSLPKILLKSRTTFYAKIDINHDGIQDSVVSSRNYTQNRLYFFVKRNHHYELLLKSINFSEDGGRIIDSLMPGNDKHTVLIIKTRFPDRGADEANYYISYERKNWFLRKIIYYTTYTDGHKLIKCTCVRRQRLNMNKLISPSEQSKILQLPEERDRSKECIINTEDIQ